VQVGDAVNVNTSVEESLEVRGASETLFGRALARINGKTPSFSKREKSRGSLSKIGHRHFGPPSCSLQLLA
jgi:hypothetical protein